MLLIIICKPLCIYEQLIHHFSKDYIYKVNEVRFYGIRRFYGLLSIFLLGSELISYAQP